MLFHVTMEVRLPPDMPEDKATQLKTTERARAQALQESGQWRHLWRVAGRYANVSIFDVESPQVLHELLSTLPLFPYMEVQVQPLCRHPSSIHPDDR
ncbi:MAG TPA: muconolactone Delta-isomerase [Myxococcaceae bacterium]|nr:muconolactone Delta-isomerase [Myxococcaceae bacterium]